MASGLTTSWQIEGEKVEAMIDFIFLGSKITPDSAYSHEIKRRLLLARKARTNLDSVLKNRDTRLPTKVHIVKTKIFPAVMYRCESWNIMKVEHQELMFLNCGSGDLEKPLDCKEILTVNPKGNQPWIFIGRSDAEAEAPILWPSDAESQLNGKDSDAGKDWRQMEKRVAEDEMVR